MKPFYVCTRRGRLKVVLLGSVEEVHKAFTGKTRSSKFTNGTQVHAFFTCPTARARSLGTITLPVDHKHITELVAHECVHASIHAERSLTKGFSGEEKDALPVADEAEERIATLAGELTGKVLTKLSAR